MQVCTREIRHDSTDENEKLRIAVEGAGLATWDWNIQTGETVLNDRWWEILGYKPSEIETSFNDWASRVHPDDYPRVMSALDAHARGVTEVYQAEYRLRHRENRWAWVLAHGRIYQRAADGTPLCVTGIHKDITERKAAEEALLLSREMYKHTVELTTQIPWIANSQGSIISCESSWEDYTGLPISAALSNDWLEAVHPDDRGQMFARWTHSIKTGEPYRVANRLRRRDGEFRYCESRAQPQRDETGAIVRWYGTTEDIHERTVSEEKLRASEARRILALEGARLATWDWKIREGVVIRDGPWFRMMGFEDTEETRRFEFWRDRIHPEDRTRINTVWDAHCADEQAPFRGEYRVRHQTGEWRWILTHGRIVERDSAGPVRACGINQDITEQHHWETALANRDRFNRLLLEASQDWIAVLDSTGRMMYLNPAGLVHLGLNDTGEASGKYWADLWRESDRTAIRQKIQDCQAGGAAAFQAYREAGQTPAGWWDVQLSPVANDAGKPGQVLAVAREITRLKEEEERQRERVERERLRGILEDLNEGVIIASPDGRVVLMNAAARRMYGFGDTLETGITCRDLFDAVQAGDTPTHTFTCEERPLARALRGESFSEVETLLLNRLNGRQWIANCGSTPVRSPEGELLLAVLSMHDVTEERRSAESLQQANESLHDLSGQLLQLQDQERRRIARELHDGSVQTLSAAIMHLTMLEESTNLASLKAETKIVAKALKFLHQTATELRNMSYLLYPPALDELGLVPAVRSWVDGYEERTGINVDLELPCTMERLTPEMETALFRITQEALGNVHRHAGSETARVTLAVTRDEIELEIRDEGRGFNRSSNHGSKGGSDFKSGVGLMGMRERANQLGGTFRIDSAHPGTVVKVRLPKRIRNG